MNKRVLFTILGAMVLFGGPLLAETPAFPRETVAAAGQAASGRG